MKMVSVSQRVRAPPGESICVASIQKASAVYVSCYDEKDSRSDSLGYLHPEEKTSPVANRRNLTHSVLWVLQPWWLLASAHGKVLACLDLGVSAEGCPWPSWRMKVGKDFLCLLLNVACCYTLGMWRTWVVVFFFK